MCASCAVRPSTASITRIATSAREMARSERRVENLSAAGPPALVRLRRGQLFVLGFFELLIAVADHNRCQPSGCRLACPLFGLALAGLSGDFVRRLRRQGPYDGVQEVRDAAAMERRHWI